MSKFDTALICMECDDKERQHPDYERATQAERKAIEAGDYNFPGIGFPGWPEPTSGSAKEGDRANIFSD